MTELQDGVHKMQDEEQCQPQMEMIFMGIVEMQTSMATLSAMAMTIS